MTPVLLLAVSIGAFAQPTVRTVAQPIPDQDRSLQFHLLDDSRLWIEGTTTVNAFSCDATTMSLSDAKASASEVRAKLDVPVDDLECGRAKMNHDLQEAMKSDQFPGIQFRLESTEVLGEPSWQDGGFPVAATGQLTVAGVQKRIQTEATAYSLDDGTYRVQGSLPIRMTDYNVTPPRVLRGLIRVRDDITVRFDLRVAETATH